MYRPLWSILPNPTEITLILVEEIRCPDLSLLNNSSRAPATVPVASNSREEAVEGDHANMDIQWIPLSFIEEKGVFCRISQRMSARRAELEATSAMLQCPQRFP
jgi:hypothetical protein